MDDPDADTVILQLFILFLLILVNAFFAMAEIAIISLNDNKIDKMASEGNKRAMQIVKLTENSSKFLSTTQIGITLAGFLTSASASQTFANMFTNWLVSLMPNMSRGFISGLSVFVITMLMAYFSLVLGELAPKRIGMQIPEKVALRVVPVLIGFEKVTGGAVRFLSFSTNLIVRLFGFDPNANEESVTEEEIRMMVDVGQEKGVIEDTQKEMINNIFEFDDMAVAEIMTHRTDMVCVNVEDPLKDIVTLSIEYGYSRIPVYEEDLDNIIGIAYIKDLLKYVGGKFPEKESINDIMRRAFYVPETMNCANLFKNMSESHVQMAIVVDEYGGTSGLITLEDLLESIVGNIQDEYDNEDEEISIIDDSTFTIDGTTDIEEVEELLGVKIPDGEYDTLGGFIISLLGFLPQDGEMNEVEYENLHFMVLNVEERRLGKIRVEILPKIQEKSI